MGLNFEKLSNNSSQELIGGFSISIGLLEQEPDATSVNNCKGGNVTVGCGSKNKKSKKKPKGINANCSGNCVTGCGG
ncbi:hypothetical protein [Fluviicola sp.]|jgi:hypothetical protein|uniref:hypothetical protein n=1 Tax=Fluviicola sp. TaxID=1917219 RepID=UPI00282D6F51|nr:hypothetical protein [Fluviicola sp.]MDR0802300.1 hypothetical protein [Fluviicola sp.]